MEINISLIKQTHFPWLLQYLIVPLTRTNLYTYIINATDDSSNLCTFTQKVQFRVAKLLPLPRAIIPSRTGDLRLVSYLRNADRAGWNFCLERQHGSATTVCANTFVDAIQKFLSPLLVAKVFNCGNFHYSVYIQTEDFIRPASFTLLSVPFPQTRIFHLISARDSRSQWPRGLRRRSAAARLLRSWVRIPPGAWMFVCCECFVLSGRGLCDELITRPEESYRLWCVVV